MIGSCAGRPAATAAARRPRARFRRVALQPMAKLGRRRHHAHRWPKFALARWNHGKSRHCSVSHVGSGRTRSQHRKGPGLTPQGKGLFPGSCNPCTGQIPGSAPRASTRLSSSTVASSTVTEATPTCSWAIAGPTRPAIRNTTPRSPAWERRTEVSRQRYEDVWHARSRRAES